MSIRRIPSVFNHQNYNRTGPVWAGAVVSFANRLCLEEAFDPAVLVHVDLLGGGDLGQAGHGEDVPGQGHEEARPGGHLQVPHGDGEVLRRAQQLGVVGEAVLGLGHADGVVAIPLRRKLGGLLSGRFGEDHSLPR